MNSDAAEGSGMRALLASMVALGLLLAAVPAEAKPEHPFPKTEKATRELVRDTLEDVDRSGAELLLAAHKIVRDAKGAVGGISLPPVDPPPQPGALEVRAALVQPGVKGVDMTVGAMWIGSSGGYWTGAYWAESDGAGQLAPRFLDVGEDGVLVFVEAGVLARGDAVNITYHFLGTDGRHVVHALGSIPLLAEMPVLERADLGGAQASSRDTGYNALLATPWNLFDENATIGMTTLAGDVILDDVVVTACADWELEWMEPGCRLFYAMPFPDELTHLQVWHVDANGARVVDRELTRGELLAGYAFSA